MQRIVPQKLKKGDKVMIVAPSRGVKLIGPDVRALAQERFEALGLRVVFADNATEENFDMLLTTTAEKRAADLMQAFGDTSVKGIFTIIGGFNCNQLLPYLDYELIRANPKILCGFSDVTALLDAIYAKTGLVTYSGPHFSSVGMLKGCDYTLARMSEMLMETGTHDVPASEAWSDDLWFLDQDKREFIKNDSYWILNEGKARGTIIGGNLGTFNLLLGTSYRQNNKKNTVLFVEDTADSDICDFMRNLTALSYQSDFGNVTGIVIGRFQKGSKVSRDQLMYMVNAIEPLRRLPVIANADFGHSTPLMTFPVGGEADFEAGGGKVRLILKD